MPRWACPHLGTRWLKQIAKLLDRKTSIADDTAHGDGVDWIVARDGQDPWPVPHYNVLALTQDSEPGLFKRTDGLQVMDAGKLGQS